MKSLVLPSVLFGCAVVFAAWVRGRKAGSGRAWPVAAQPLLSVPEQVLYRRLREAFPDHVVLAQVALSQLIVVRAGPQWQAVHNRINRLVADFVVCSPDFTTLLVIELDDRSHGRRDRQDADARKSEALAAAGLRLVRYSVKSMPDVATLRAELEARQPSCARSA